MTEFEEKVLDFLSIIQKQQAIIVDTLNKSLDIAVGSDNFNVDDFKSFLGNNEG